MKQLLYVKYAYVLPVWTPEYGIEISELLGFSGIGVGWKNYYTTLEVENYASFAAWIVDKYYLQHLN